MNGGGGGGIGTTTGTGTAGGAAANGGPGTGGNGATGGNGKIVLTVTGPAGTTNCSTEGETEYANSKFYYCDGTNWQIMAQ